MTLGPPTFGFSSPLAASAMSRTISPSTRKRGPRASSRLYGSFSSSSGVDCASLPVGRRVDDQPVQVLDCFQPVLDELDGQPVEQLGVRRRLALRAEVLAGRDEAGAEVGLPDAVDERARGRRRLRIDEPPRERQARRRRVRRQRVQDRGHAGPTGLPGFSQSPRLSRLRRRASRRGPASDQLRRRRSGCCLPEGLDLLVGLLPLGHGRAPVA